MKETKVCLKCKEEKHVDLFNKDAKGRDGLKSRCKACLSEEYKARYYRDHEETKRKNREYHRSNKEQFAANSKAYRLRNIDRCKARDAKRARDYPHQAAARASKRRSVVRKAIPSWDIGNKQSAKDIENMFLMAQRLSELTGEKWTIDHMVPLTAKSDGKTQVACGLHTLTNLTLMKAGENYSKNAFSWPDSWDYRYL